MSRAEGRKFGLLVGGAFILLAVLMVRRDHDVAAWIFGVVGLLLFAGGLAVPTRLEPAYHAWMGLAHAISRVTTPIIMGIIFFLILTPVGLLARLLGHRPLNRKRSGSYWESRPAGAGRGNLNHQF